MSSEPSSNLSIRVQNLSKLYRLNAQQVGLRDVLASSLKRLVSVQKASDNEKNSLWALREVNFKLYRGEALGIIGPNGAGKTTMLKILSRVTRPTQGQVRVNGRLGALLELGAGFHPDLTGRENIFLYGQILGLSKPEIHKRFDQIVDFSGLERFIDTPVKRYSSGMYVRLAFSVASSTNPDVLLVDEVLAVGDADFRQKCVQRIEVMQQHGVSIIFISHNLSQVRAVCSRGIFLNAGQIQLDGSVDEAISAYENWYRTSKNGSAAEHSFEVVKGQGGSDLQLLGVELLDLQGQEKQAFNYLENAEIRVHYLAQELFPTLGFVVRIIRSDGLVCAVLRSSDLDCAVEGIEGKGYLSLHLGELRLASGTYLIEVRMRDASDAVTLAKSSSVSFNVKGPSQGSDRNIGVYVPHLSNVSVHPIPLIPFDSAIAEGDNRQ